MIRKIKMSIVDKYFETVDNKIVNCYIKTRANSITGYKRTFKGTAKWDGTGKFDYNFAKKLALARAEIKARTFYKKYTKRILDEVLQDCNRLSNFVDQCSNQITHNKNYVKNLIEKHFE